MIKNILFDLDETIFDFHMAERNALIKTLHHFDIESTEQIIKRYSEINLAQWKLLEKKIITRDELKVRRFKLLFGEIGCSCSPCEATEFYAKRLSEGGFYINGAEELLKKLISKYRLYIVSNGFLNTQKGRIKSAGAEKYFNGIFISEEIGCDKPSVEFFDKCFSKIPDFNKVETIIVGDSISSDIKGGKNAGITTVWFNSAGVVNNSDVIPDYEICSLDELELLLKKI